LKYSILLTVCAIAIVYSKPDADQLRAFEAWARENNDFISEKLSINSDDISFQQLRPGVKAIEDIAEDELIAEFPKDFIINSKILEFHDIGELVPKAHFSFSNKKMHDPAYLESLALFFIYEKYVNRDGPYKPWMDVLPEASEMNNILFWKPSEIKWLVGSPLYKRATDRRKEAKDRWQVINDNLIIPYDRLWKITITEEMYIWAISIVRSRAVQIAVKSGNVEIYEPGVVPFFDMFRHQPLTREAAWEFDMGEKTLYLRSDSDIKAGDEVFVAYGEKCNSELLDFHGYIIPDNENDCVHVDLEISKNDPLFSEKNIIYRARAPDDSQIKFLQNGLTVELLRGARTVTLEDDMITNQMLMRGCPDESLGLISDFKIAQYLLDRIRAIYTAYPRDEDIEGFEESDLPLRRRLAKQLKDGEMQILRKMGTYYFSEVERLSEEIVKNKDEL